MWIVVIAFLFLSVIVVPAHSENAVAELNAILRLDSYGEMNDRIRNYVQQNQGSVQAEYVTAVTEINANTAVARYKRLSAAGNGPESQASLLRVAQYHMARGFYITARKHYLELLEKYPESPYAEAAFYQAAVCLLPASDYDTCYAELNRFIDQYPNSALVAAAKADAKSIKPSVAKTTRRPTGGVLTRAGNYSLQIGAFEQANNALNLRNYVAKLGYAVEIVEKGQNEDRMYQVLLGSFATEEEARRFGETFKKSHGKLYRVVTKK